MLWGAGPSEAGYTSCHRHCIVPSQGANQELMRAGALISWYHCFQAKARAASLSHDALILSPPPRDYFRSWYSLGISSNATSER